MSEKRIDEILKKIKKEQISVDPELIDELTTLADQNFSYIIKNGLDSFLNLLEVTNISGDLQPKTITLLKKLVEKDSTVEETLFSFLSKPKLLPILFSHARSGQKEIYEILEALYLSSPPDVIQLIINSPNTVTPLIQCVASSNNPDASKFLIILNGLGGVKELIEPQIKENLQKFPLSVSLDILVGYKDTAKEMPQDQFEEWVLNKSSNFSILDIQQIFDFYPGVWNTSTAVKLFINSTPSPILSHMDFCSKREAQKIDVTPEDAKAASDSVVSAPISLVPNSNEEASFFFMRIYILSLCDSSLVTDKAKEVVYKHILASEEYLSAAAIQCVLFWATKQASLPSKVVYLIAASMHVTERTKEFIALARAAVMSLAMTHNSAATITLLDPGMKFDEQQLQLLTSDDTPKWLFPHVKASLGSILSEKIYDDTLSVDIIGGIAEYFNL